MSSRFFRNISLYIGLFTCGLVSSIVGAILPALKTEISMSYLQSGIILSANFIGMLIAVISTGLFVDRIGKKPMVMIGGVFLLTGLSLSALSHVYLFLLAGIILTGIGFGLYEISINALCTDLSDAASAASSMSLLHFFYGLGAMLGPVIVSLCLRFSGSWRLSFGLFILLPLLTSGFLIPLKIAKPSPRMETHEKPMGSGKGFLLIAGFAIVLYVGAEVSASGWLPLYWGRFGSTALGVSAPITASIFWAMLTLGRLIFGKLADKLGYALFLGISAAAALACALAWAIIPGALATLLCASLMGLAMSCVYPAIMASATSRFPAYSGFVSSLISVFAAISGFIIPTCFGQAADQLGIGILPWVLCGLMGAFLALALIGWRGAGPRAERGQGRA